MLGDLKILRTDIKPMQWIKPETKGIQPKPRCGHTMDFSQEFNFIIIHGGKNDSDPDVFFNDLFILNVEDYNWIKIQVQGRIPKPKANHSSYLYGTYTKNLKIYFYFVLRIKANIFWRN